MKKILKYISNIILSLIIIVTLFVTIITIFTNRDGIPDVFGYSPFSIQSNSMASTINKGDLIITKKISNNPNIKEGDIISFYSTINGKNVIKTHRVINIRDESGVNLYITKGDANDVEDTTFVTEVDIISKYNGIRIPFLGYLLDFTKNKWVFLFLILIPLLIIFIYQLIDFIKLLIKYKMEKLEEELD